MGLFNKIKGGLYGVAIGDALGGTTEFMSKKEIQQSYGYLTEMIGGGVWELRPGEVTDDTQMTLCVAEGILENPQDPKHAIGEKFLQWYQSDPKDIGNIIKRVLSTYEGNWFEAAFLADLDLGQSAGNGSLMRCIPVGLIYPHLRDIENISRIQSKMTHYDERCNQACEIYNRIVFKLLHDELLVEAIKSEIVGTEYEDILTREPECESSGFVVHTFRWVLHILLTSHSFPEVVQRAANLGGDTDTIAAIAGGLAGVYHGFESIPYPYANTILIKNKLDTLTGQMIELRQQLGMSS
ncbi:ADP-ribosylglycohydrolase family protein [Paenibacillus sp. N3.4]|uniref:ADP-ribosylglycohydrolase family protein n=1 Tax=Paenibacillus sp. N3.4 TaxID=2603222 RepID=UPI0011C93AD9|nr:ADP-ribosylglycohydrolase family protein [Paenibacillus sp. N3.4]TXK72433.1 ADP-ribosyl-[dinitrogen reductase] hydrolase [Paenibacillus sp. N3.4]